MDHVEAAEGSNYRDELLSRIIQICSHNNYQYISNFEWFLVDFIQQHLLHVSQVYIGVGGTNESRGHKTWSDDC